MVETVALAFALHKRLAAFLQDHDVKALDEFLMKGIAGSRLSDAEIQSVNVLTLIKHVEKEVPGFSASYDSLSEFAHPNWAGILGTYGRIDQGSFELILGQNDRSDGMRRGLSALSGALLVFQHFYDDMFKMLHQLNAYFDNAKGAA